MKLNGHVLDSMDKKQKKLKEIEEFVINSGSKGVTVKDICEKFNLTATTAARYVKEMHNSGVISRSVKQHYYVYTWSTSKEPEKKVEETEEPSGGVEFDVVIPAKNVDQRDVIYASSRSGGGLFFKYLVLTPWAHKATVIGIFDEGHPVLDLNSTQFVYIGDDPETGKKMYADLSNVCSRGDKTFGKKLTKISIDHMDAVKYFLARYYRIEAKTRDSEGSNFKVKDLEGRLKASEGARMKLINDLDRERKEHKQVYQEKCGDYSLLQAEYNTRMREFDDTKKMLSDANESLKSAIEQIDTLQSQLNAAKATVKADPKYNEDYIKGLESSVDALKFEYASLEAANKCLQDHNVDLYKIVLAALGTGKQGGEF